MIIYNVTLSINPEIETEVLQWLKSEHIPDVLATGLFVSGKLFRIMETEGTESPNSFAVQYHLESWDHLDKYQKEHAARLQQITREKYGENVLAFRTFLEELD